jgi:hypothetical protein
MKKIQNLLLLVGLIVGVSGTAFCSEKFAPKASCLECKDGLSLFNLSQEEQKHLNFMFSVFDELRKEKGDDIHEWENFRLPMYIRCEWGEDLSDFYLLVGELKEVVLDVNNADINLIRFKELTNNIKKSKQYKALLKQRNNEKSREKLGYRVKSLIFSAAQISLSFLQNALNSK